MNTSVLPTSPLRETATTARVQIVKNFIVLIEQYISEAKDCKDEDRQLLVEEGSLTLNNAYKEYLNLLTVGADGVRQSGALQQLGIRLGDLALQLNQVFALRIFYERAEDELTE